MPLHPILRDIFQMGIKRQHRSRALCSPPLHTRKSVRAVPHYPQIIRNRLRLHAELGHHAQLIPKKILSPIQLHHPCAHDALAQIFVWRANQHLPHAIIQGSLRRGRSQRIIGLEVDHRPH